MKSQIRNMNETDTVNIKHTDRDGSVYKMKFPIYEDGSDEEFP